MVSCNRVSFSATSEMATATNMEWRPDKRDVWYTRDDFVLFKADRTGGAKAVRRQISSKRVPNAGDVLGLEKFMTPQLTREYAQRRERVTWEVLEEANFGNGDAEQLARVSAANSKWARQRARAAALYLERDLKHRDP